MNKKITLILSVLLLTLTFFGCASKQEETLEIPATIEARAAMTDFVAVTDASQIEGVWVGGYTQALTGMETGLPFDVDITAAVSLVYPVTFKGVDMIQYTEEADYTSYLQKLSEIAGMDSAAVWALMVNQFEGIEYTTEAPYIMKIPTLVQPTDTDFLSALFVSADGKQLKIAAGIGFEIYLEKQN